MTARSRIRPASANDKIASARAINDRRAPGKNVRSSGCQTAAALRYTHWPLESWLTSGPQPSAVPCSRLHTRLVLADWGLGTLVQDAELIVSELVTNAVRESARLEHPLLPSVSLRLRSDGHRLLIEVRDRSPRLPQARDADLFAEDGRGLAIVAALSDEHGAFPLVGKPGKVTWSLLDARPGNGRNA